MLTLIRNGGTISMLFILATALVALAAAFHFALRAQRKSLDFVKKLSIATLFGTLAASCADVGATLNAASRVLEKNEADVAQAFHLICEGFSESTSPGILGFTFLALIWMLVAVGKRRLDEREGAAQ